MKQAITPKFEIKQVFVPNRQDSRYGKTYNCTVVYRGTPVYFNAHMRSTGKVELTNPAIVFNGRLIPVLASQNTTTDELTHIALFIGRLSNVAYGTYLRRYHSIIVETSEPLEYSE